MPQTTDCLTCTHNAENTAKMPNSLKKLAVWN